MKRPHKALIGILALTAAGLTVWTAAAKRGAVVPPDAAAPKSGAAMELPGAAAAPQDKAPVEKAAPPPAPQASPVEMPADLKVTTRTTPAGRVVTVERRGHLVTVWRGAERRTEMQKVAWTARDGGSAPLMWETTSEKTLQTIRGEIAMEGDRAEARHAVAPAVVQASAAYAHVCKAHNDPAGGFVVLCQVDAPSAAASVEGKDPKEGVWSMAGDRTALFRFEMPVGEQGADTKVIGYEKGGKGVLLRVEASRVAGESSPLLAIGADARSQPERPRPRCCKCFLPPRDSLL